jgi:hypothetical protein
MAKGQAAKNGPFFQFFHAVKKAESEASVLVVRVVREAAKGGAVVRRTVRTLRDGTVKVVEKYARPRWQAAAWWLERRYPEDWGRDRHDIKALQDKLQALQELLQPLGVCARDAV